MKAPSATELEAVGRHMVRLTEGVTGLRFVGSERLHDRGYWEVKFQAPNKEWFVAAVRREDIQEHLGAA